MTGADIGSIVLVGLGLSLVDGTDALTPDLLDEVVLRRNRVEDRPPLRPLALRRIAGHEAGHALFAAANWGPDTLASVTVGAGGEGGETTLDDAFLDSSENDSRLIRERVAWSVAGLVAEEIVFGPTATSIGSGSDLSQATHLVRRLVTSLGAAATLGAVDVSVVEFGHHSDHGSESMRASVWEAIRAESMAGLALARAALSTPGRPGAVRRSRARGEEPDPVRSRADGRARKRGGA